MNHPKISFCIPTYNRENCLFQCIESIITQSGYNADEIEIIISDNASWDNTQVRILDFIKTHENIHYFRNSENLGYDRNVHNTIIHSNGDFCWLMSDDEELLPESLNYITDLLETHKDIAYLCVNISGNTVKNLPNDIVFQEQNGQEIIRKYGVVWWLISQNIFKREYYPEDASKHFWSLWIHLLVIYEIIKNRSVLLVNKEIIRWQDWWEARWKNEWKVLLVFTSLKRVFISIRDVLGYDKDVMNAMISEFIKTLPTVIISAKVQWYPFWIDAFKLLIKEYKNYPFYLFLALIISIIPKFIFTSIKKILWK